MKLFPPSFSIIGTTLSREFYSEKKRRFVYVAQIAALSCFLMHFAGFNLPWAMFFLEAMNALGINDT